MHITSLCKGVADDHAEQKADNYHIAGRRRSCLTDRYPGFCAVRSELRGHDRQGLRHPVRHRTPGPDRSLRVLHVPGIRRDAQLFPV